MKKEIKKSKKSSSKEDIEKVSELPENIMRRDAIKRIALLFTGGIAGTFMANSCIPYSDYSDYDDYYDYYDYYYNYYSNYHNYSDYYYNYYSNYSNYKGTD